MSDSRLQTRITASHLGRHFYIRSARWLHKKKRLLRGLIWTHFRTDINAYKAGDWFDKHYSHGVSDRQTIESNTNPIVAQYHYASVELIITRELLNYRYPVDGAAVLDIGSGSGHWLKFYKTIGAEKCVGIEASKVACQYLNDNLASDKIEIHQGLFQQVLTGNRNKYDIINAVGVLFHVVDDSEWINGLTCIANSLKEGGVLIVGGHFGWINNVNVQVDPDGSINKRLRSKAYWKKNLKRIGFKKIKICKNPAYLGLKDYVPENNILIAWR